MEPSLGIRNDEYAKLIATEGALVVSRYRKLDIVRYLPRPYLHPLMSKIDLKEGGYRGLGGAEFEISVGNEGQVLRERFVK